MLWDQCCAGHNRYYSDRKIFFLEESYKNLNQYGFSIGVFLVIIGVCTLVKNQEMAKSFQLYIGVCILLTAIIKLQNAMDLKALKDRTWGSHLCRILSDRSMCGSHYHESVF